MVITETTQRQFDFLMQKELTAEEVVAYLNDGFSIRLFSDVLTGMYPHGDLRERLTNAAGSRKTVWNWMNNKNLPADREDVFLIAFALELNEYAADELLKYVFEDGIHYRNEKELIYAFALKNRQPYQAAVSSAELFGRRGGVDADARTVTTQMMKLAFDSLPVGADFIEFLMAHQGSLGSMHKTAYKYFMEMLSCLGDMEDSESSYSIEYICSHYLRLGMPQERKTSSYSMVQRMVKKYWPGARTIKAMKNQKEDVSRKTLILLYLATGGIRNGAYDETDEEYVSPQDRLLENLTRLDRMLQECGMRTIDPRRPFDFLVVYCLNTGADESMGERMEEIIAMLFGE